MDSAPLTAVPQDASCRSATRTTSCPDYPTAESAASTRRIDAHSKPAIRADAPHLPTASPDADSGDSTPLRCHPEPKRLAASRQPSTWSATEPAGVGNDTGHSHNSGIFQYGCPSPTRPPGRPAPARSASGPGTCRTRPGCRPGTGAATGPLMPSDLSPLCRG
jgi:hypothetical protein